MRNSFHPTTAKDYDRAKQLRHESSTFEQKLWAALREISRIEQLKFRRQQPIHPYIADFACMKVKLLVELDGDSHDTQKAQAYDQARDAYLKKQGYVVMRVSNDEIKDNLSGVIDAIVTRAKALISSPLEGEDSFSKRFPFLENA